MGHRKPLPEECNGSIDCPVPGHNTVTRQGPVTRFRHIKLTDGQWKTLRERQDAEWAARAAKKGKS